MMSSFYIALFAYPWAPFTSESVLRFSDLCVSSFSILILSFIFGLDKCSRWIQVALKLNVLTFDDSILCTNYLFLFLERMHIASRQIYALFYFCALRLVTYVMHKNLYLHWGFTRIATYIISCLLLQLIVLLLWLTHTCHGGQMRG